MARPLTIQGVYAAAPRLTLGAAGVLAALTCLPLLIALALT